MSDSNDLVEALRRRGIADERVLSVIASVDRSRFVPSASAEYAWDDVALPIAGGQTISQPYIVALMSEALDLRGDETVLEIGTGSGYQAAVLCRLCEHVVTIERLPELQDDAKRVLSEIGCNNIGYRAGDGTLGSPADAPFDGILVTAGAPDVPPALYEQLKEEGRLVIPVGPIEQQELVVLEKTPAGPKRRSLCGCRFVKLIGEQGWRE
ncbi:MAG: protein-L-isoaspartate(D-aspartate) O-methyltransferase [Planctomycetota bacterium]|nr:protein-L-isoaspartate(D-aspartate) O-methyltransferase [Planctomycetaceae bacterium]MDQ3332321.1 protein-L-isoaspartate(D-aspartate) O-methyltransferase [Planctomycetota bacterium]